MPSLPQLDIKTGLNHSPHVVILGAGASRACCPNGDANGNILPVMNDLVETLKLAEAVERNGGNKDDNFESIYSALHRSGKKSALKEFDEAVRIYFEKLRLPSSVTLYDHLILSLRPKDYVVTFNWDPLLCQAYKRWRHLGDVLPQICFLHGNVDIGINIEQKVSGFLSDKSYPDRKLSPTPLLFPIEKKDYNTDLFVKDQWEKATNALSYAYYATIYGYSAPSTDVEARSLLLEAWKSNPTMRLAEFDVIDIREKEEVEKSWADFIVESHGGASDTFAHNILMQYPRRTCESFAFATLQQAPWHEDPFPETNDLKQLEAWVEPLIAEEKTGKLAGKPHH